MTPAIHRLGTYPSLNVDRAHNGYFEYELLGKRLIDGALELAAEF
jgi:hypothetical protein